MLFKYGNFCLHAAQLVDMPSQPVASDNRSSFEADLTSLHIPL